jgi:hypothetical protein
MTPDAVMEGAVVEGAVMEIPLTLRTKRES